MSSSADPPTPLTAKEATQKFNKMKAKVNSVVATDDHYTRYLGVTQTVLSQFPMTGQAITPANFENPREIKDVMASLLPPAGEVYTDEYFRAPIYPIILLENMACFYGFDTEPEQFITELYLSGMEASNKSIGTQIWFAFLQELDVATTRSVIDRYKTARESPNIAIHARAVAAYTGGAQPQTPTAGYDSLRTSAPKRDERNVPHPAQVESIPPSAS